MSRYLGIDLGTKKAGISISDDGGIMAWPLEIVYFDSHRELLVNIRRIVKAEEIHEIVLGKPIRSSQEEKMDIDMIDDFKLLMERGIGIRVSFENEIYSTQMVIRSSEVLGGKNLSENVDDRAAAVILQSFLDRKNKDERKQ